MVEIQLKFTAQQAKYIHTKPLHPSQHVLEETREYTIFTFRLMQNYELESLILSFGERVEVLRPEGLREKVKGRVGKLFDEYAAGGAP
ncbi:MAG: WYL domain-containing protein [Phaeodactylibacter sp.]|nr:WYL domain-containing protein [Phaeodactylibacter sp.]MCB9301132.1 WYL domain-containing protein [Lewinellaceae bacterium]